ncbi:MAG: ATP-binding cassette domain-containing protein [Oscillospiraceae bacterium]|jgi:excinuclease UvrABC ATPase subunit|nr:ATP-binding cassette domain-containing protein [Oscillospiraceae bacterium]
MPKNRNITINGIQTNNLKNIDVSLIKGGLNLIVGPSGSGKSSLAYDTIAQIGQYELFSMFADDFSETTYKVQDYCNMIATIPIKQINHNNNIRSTIGTYFGLNNCISCIYANELELDESSFVLNKAENLCENCHGIGVIKILDESRIIDYNKPLESNPFKCWNVYKDFYEEILIKFCNENNINSKKTFRELSETEKKKILYGESKNKYVVKYKRTNGYSKRTTKFFGVMSGKPMIMKFTPSSKYYSDSLCPICHGKKYAQNLDVFRIAEVSIGNFMLLPFEVLQKHLKKLKTIISSESLLSYYKIETFIKKANELGLGHLYFHRSIPTLSGGELQRLRMVQVFCSQLSDLLIVLDEPLAGLSGDEKVVVFNNVIDLSAKHTLVIVEHSDVFAEKAKKIIALGEKSGIYGGHLIDPNEYLKSQRMINTVRCLNPSQITEINITSNVYNYNGLKMKFAVNRINLITGKSGSGKTTLLREYLPQYFDSYEYLNQKPLLGNSNSSVATVLEFFRPLLKLFAQKHKKDTKFFYNLVEGKGACPKCAGKGYLEYIDGHRFTCKECTGTGFNPILKKYMIANKNIFDIFDMTIDESIEYFDIIDKKISALLSKASDILLGHLRIGQPTSTLSGGENIRVKILKLSLSKKTYLGIDEPFKGLSNTEVFTIMQYLRNLINQGKTLIVVEHNEDTFQYFDYKLKLNNKNGLLLGQVIR